MIIIINHHSFSMFITDFFFACQIQYTVVSKKSVYILSFTYSFIHIWWLKNFGFSLSFSTLFPITVVCLFLLFRFSSLFIQKQVNTKLIFWERIKQWSGLFSSVRYVKLINWHEWYPYDDDDDDRRSELFPKDDIAEFFSACSYYYYYYYLFHTWIIYNIYLSIYYLAVLLYSFYIHRYCFIINTIELARHNNNNNISFYFADRYRFNLVMNFFPPNRQHSTAQILLDRSRFSLLFFIRTIFHFECPSCTHHVNNKREHLWNNCQKTAGHFFLFQRPCEWMDINLNSFFSLKYSSIILETRIPWF